MVKRFGAFIVSAGLMAGVPHGTHEPSFLSSQQPESPSFKGGLAGTHTFGKTNSHSKGIESSLPRFLSGTAARVDTVLRRLSVFGMSSERTFFPSVIAFAGQRSPLLRAALLFSSGGTLLTNRVWDKTDAFTPHVPTSFALGFMLPGEAHSGGAPSMIGNVVLGALVNTNPTPTVPSGAVQAQVTHTESTVPSYVGPLRSSRTQVAVAKAPLQPIQRRSAVSAAQPLAVVESLAAPVMVAAVTPMAFSVSPAVRDSEPNPSNRFFASQISLPRQVNTEQKRRLDERGSAILHALSGYTVASGVSAFIGNTTALGKLYFDALLGIFRVDDSESSLVSRAMRFFGTKVAIFAGWVKNPMAYTIAAVLRGKDLSVGYPQGTLQAAVLSYVERFVRYTFLEAVLEKQGAMKGRTVGREPRDEQGLPASVAVESAPSTDPLMVTTGSSGSLASSSELSSANQFPVEIMVTAPSAPLSPVIHDESYPMASPAADGGSPVSPGVSETPATASLYGETSGLSGESPAGHSFAVGAKGAALGPPALAVESLLLGVPPLVPKTSGAASSDSLVFATPSVGDEDKEWERVDEKIAGFSPAASSSSSYVPHITGLGAVGAAITHAVVPKVTTAAATVVATAVSNAATAAAPYFASMATHALAAASTAGAAAAPYAVAAVASPAAPWIVGAAAAFTAVQVARRALSGAPASSESPSTAALAVSVQPVPDDEEDGVQPVASTVPGEDGVTRTQSSKEPLDVKDDDNETAESFFVVSSAEDSFVEVARPPAEDRVGEIIQSLQSSLETSDDASDLSGAWNRVARGPFVGVLNSGPLYSVVGRPETPFHLWIRSFFGYLDTCIRVFNLEGDKAEAFHRFGSELFAELLERIEGSPSGSASNSSFSDDGVSLLLIQKVQGLSSDFVEKRLKPYAHNVSEFISEVRRYAEDVTPRPLTLPPLINAKNLTIAGWTVLMFDYFDRVRAVVGKLKASLDISDFFARMVLLSDSAASSSQAGPSSSLSEDLASPKNTTFSSFLNLRFPSLTQVDEKTWTPWAESVLRSMRSGGEAVSQGRPLDFHPDLSRFLRGEIRDNNNRSVAEAMFAGLYPNEQLNGHAEQTERDVNANHLLFEFLRQVFGDKMPQSIKHKGNRYSRAISADEEERDGGWVSTSVNYYSHVSEADGDEGNFVDLMNVSRDKNAKERELGSSFSSIDSRDARDDEWTSVEVHAGMGAAVAEAASSSVVVLTDTEIFRDKLARAIKKIPAPSWDQLHLQTVGGWVSNIFDNWMDQVYKYVKSYVKFCAEEFCLNDKQENSLLRKGLTSFIDLLFALEAPVGTIVRVSVDTETLNQEEEQMSISSPALRFLRDDLQQKFAELRGWTETSGLRTKLEDTIEAAFKVRFLKEKAEKEIRASWISTTSTEEGYEDVSGSTVRATRVAMATTKTKAEEGSAARPPRGPRRALASLGNRRDWRDDAGL